MEKDKELALIYLDINHLCSPDELTYFLDSKIHFIPRCLPVFSLPFAYQILVQIGFNFSFIEVKSLHKSINNVQK